MTVNHYLYNVRTKQYEYYTQVSEIAHGNTVYSPKYLTLTNYDNHHMSYIENGTTMDASTGWIVTKDQTFYVYYSAKSYRLQEQKHLLQ